MGETFDLVLDIVVDSTAYRVGTPKQLGHRPYRFLGRPSDPHAITARRSSGYAHPSTRGSGYVRRRGFRHRYRHRCRLWNVRPGSDLDPEPISISRSESSSVSHSGADGNRPNVPDGLS